MVGGPAMALVTSPCTYCVRLCARHQGFGVRGAPCPSLGRPVEEAYLAPASLAQLQPELQVWHPTSLA